MTFRHSRFSRYSQCIGAGLLATFGLAAMAQMPPQGPAGDTAPHGMREHRMDPAKMQEHMAKRQAALKQKLQITPAQEGAWNAWTTAMQPGDFKRPERGEFEKLTTPERIDRMRALREQHIAQMDKRAEATKTFYATLTPEQKKTFDAATAHGPRGGHRHHAG
jgi:periplasmic protein CpxP/Spy